MVDLSGYSDEQLRQLQQQLPPSTQGAAPGSFATAPIPPDLSKYSDEQLRQMQQQLPPSSGPSQGGPVAAAQGWFGQLNAAWQGTSPVVRDVKGNLNYNRLGEPTNTDAPGYVDSSGKWQIFDPVHHVMLTDPATGKMTVFERNQEMEENRLTALGRLASFGVLSGPPPTIPLGQGGATAAALGSPVAKTAANLATAGGTGLLAHYFGLPETVSGLVGAALGFGPHSTGGGLGGDVMQSLSRMLPSYRAPLNAVPIMNPGTAAIPGLLTTTTGAVAGQSPYGYLPP